MAESGARASSEGPRGRAPSGVSEFIGKVLDQLSLTSWMPAAMLVGIGAILVQFYAQATPSLVGAVANLTTNAVGVAVVLLFAVVLGAVVTQAFSFETIRFLEGYWGLARLTRPVMQARTGAHARRREGLSAQVEQHRTRAFEVARSAMWADRIPVAYIEVLEDDFYDQPEGTRRAHEPAVTRSARQMGWRPKASPADLATLERLERRLGEYPARHRVLPTRLGNVIRAAEDALERDGHELEGLIMRNYDVIPTRLMVQHDQFRDRLDMYCTLVPVFALLALGYASLLLRGQLFISTATLSALGCVALAIVSYQAAIASARGYGAALSAIASRVAEKQAQPA
ncbi:hypothetical protein GALL_335820 [mine drainage metagenome]|uniref:Uncharacterized protein n=1 Tax=mine drainage metagenome TaxID=410659 RepID=A0A1J5R8X0_9ZZZZ